MEMNSHDDYYDIEAAIRTGDIAYARERIREMIRQQPTADIWFLAAQVARTPQQRRSLLERALLTDPNHARARSALNTMRNLQVIPPSDNMMTRIRRIFRREMA